MALDLGDLNEFFDGGMLATVRGAKHPDGKQYRIPPVSGELGLWGRRLVAFRAELGDNPTAEQLADVSKEIGPPPVPEGLTTEQAFLSPELHAQLLADGVDDEMIRHMGQLVYARILGGDRLALAFARGEDPKANRAQRRAAAKAVKKAAPKKASSSRTTSTGEAATTRKAASGSTTKSPRKSSSSAKRAASRGGTS